MTAEKERDELEGVNPVWLATRDAHVRQLVSNRDEFVEGMRAAMTEWDEAARAGTPHWRVAKKLADATRVFLADQPRGGTKMTLSKIHLSDMDNARTALTRLAQTAESADDVRILRVLIAEQERVTAERDRLAATLEAVREALAGSHLLQRKVNEIRSILDASVVSDRETPTEREPITNNEIRASVQPVEMMTDQEEDEFFGDAR